MELVTSKMLIPEVANALKKEERLETLQLLQEGYTLSEIADELEMSFAGVQSYAEDLEDAHLVKEVEGTRTITQLGEIVLERFLEIEEELQAQQKDMIKSSLAQDLEEAREYGITEDEIKELLKG